MPFAVDDGQAVRPPHGGIDGALPRCAPFLDACQVGSPVKPTANPSAWYEAVTPIWESDVTQAQLDGLDHKTFPPLEFTSNMDTQDPRSGKPNKRRVVAAEAISQTYAARLQPKGRISANQESSRGAVAKCTLSSLEEAAMAPGTEQKDSI